jgi:hypothetical protein
VSRAGSGRPVIYRSGKLPKDLPRRFAKLDTNVDAQIGLQEWRVGSRAIPEFEGMDWDDDGLLTVEELLCPLAWAAPAPPGRRRNPDPRGVVSARLPPP